MEQLRQALALWVCGMVITALAAEASAQDAKGGKVDVYIGTYTRGDSKGIYLLELDLASGKLTDKGLAGAVAHPSFLAIHPNKRYLYAVSEVATVDGQKGGGVTAFAIDPKTGKLTELNRQLSGGTGPCHLVVDQEGKAVLVANYGSGSVASLPLQADGRLKEAASVIQHEGSSVNPQRQQGPHAHSINLDANNRYAMAADLGLDKVLVYRFDPAQGTLTPSDPPSVSTVAGGGPRHFAFHPNGRNAYTNNEILSSVTAFQYDPDKGILKELQTLSTLPKNFKGNNSTAEIQVHPSGKFLYVSNRGHDSIAIFAIGPDGKLTAQGHQSTQGKTPRNFGIDPTGTYLLAANQATDNVVAFRIDPETGQLTPTGSSVNVPAPVCVKFLAR
ncbi:MAG: lactonase family protein [Gemmataceae bacterium]